MDDAQAPDEIRVAKDRRSLTLRWSSGAEATLPAEFLRVVSPSAEVQGHSPEQRVTVGGKRDVTIADLRPVGHYAVRIVFDDRHDSGLYTWRYLRTLADERETRWATYLEELAVAGLTR